MIYKIKFLIALIVLCFVSQRLEAQDVIVKKDGTTILSKVLEVNETNLRYKKFKNPQGPTICKSTFWPVHQIRQPQLQALLHP